MTGGHGIVNPVDVKNTQGDATEAVESLENASNKNRLHFQIESKNSHRGIGCNGIQFVMKGQGRKHQTPTVGGLTLYDGDDCGKNVFADIGQELEGVELVEQVFGKWFEDRHVVPCSGGSLGKPGGDGSRYDSSHGKPSFIDDLHKIQVMDGIDAEVGIVAEHGLVVISLVFRTVGPLVRPTGSAPPELLVHGHDQKSDIRIQLHVVFAEACAELTERQLLGACSHDAGDERHVNVTFGIDAGNQTDFFRRLKGLDFILAERFAWVHNKLLAANGLWFQIVRLTWPHRSNEQCPDRRRIPLPLPTGY